MKRPDGSWDPFDEYVLDFAIERMRAGERVALVTLVEIEGSSPRSLGAQMAVSEAGRWVGYLSGGCIERAIVAEAVDAIVSGRSRRVRYGRGSRYIDISLPCGSAIELVFEVDLSLARLGSVDAHLRRRQPATLDIPLGPDFDGPAEREAFLTRTYQPRRRLVILGVGPVAVQLARLAASAGFEVRLGSTDDATLLAVGGLDIVVGTVGGNAAVPAGWIDEWSAVALVFHDHDREEKLLPAVLASDAFYIGAMGSRQTHRKRIEGLKARGVDERQAGRIKGPAGLLPNARSAMDIALSILAEVVEAGRQAQIGVPVAASPAPSRIARPEDVSAEAYL